MKLEELHLCFREAVGILAQLFSDLSTQEVTFDFDMLVFTPGAKPQVNKSMYLLFIIGHCSAFFLKMDKKNPLPYRGEEQRDLRGTTLVYRRFTTSTLLSALNTPASNVAQRLSLLRPTGPST